MNEMNEMNEIRYTETNDCTVRAISQAFNITYEASHALCKAYGRVDRAGFHVDAKLLGAMRDRLFILDQYTGKVVSSVLKLIDPLGTYICLVDGHMFCIRNQKSLDGFDNSRKRIRRIFKGVTK